MFLPSRSILIYRFQAKIRSNATLDCRGRGTVCAASFSHRNRSHRDASFPSRFICDHQPREYFMQLQLRYPRSMRVDIFNHSEHGTKRHSPLSVNDHRSRIVGNLPLKIQLPPFEETKRISRCISDRYSPGMVRLYFFYDVLSFSFFYIHIYIYIQVVKFPSIRLFRYFLFRSLLILLRSVDLRCSLWTKILKLFPWNTSNASLSTIRSHGHSTVSVSRCCTVSISADSSNIDQFLIERAKKNTFEVNAIGTRHRDRASFLASRNKANKYRSPLSFFPFSSAGISGNRRFNIFSALGTVNRRKTHRGSFPRCFLPRRRIFTITRAFTIYFFQQICLCVVIHVHTRQSCCFDLISTMAIFSALRARVFSQFVRENEKREKWEQEKKKYVKVIVKSHDVDSELVSLCIWSCFSFSFRTTRAWRLFKTKDLHDGAVTLNLNCLSAGYSEDSDYTSDLNYPVGGQGANSSASQFRTAANQLATPQRSLETSRENSYERDDHQVLLDRYFVVLVDVSNDVNWKLWKLHGHLGFQSNCQTATDLIFKKVPRTLRKYESRIRIRNYCEDVRNENLLNY